MKRALIFALAAISVALAAPVSDAGADATPTPAAVDPAPAPSAAPQPAVSDDSSGKAARPAVYLMARSVDSSASSVEPAPTTKSSSPLLPTFGRSVVEEAPAVDKRGGQRIAFAGGFKQLAPVRPFEARDVLPLLEQGAEDLIEEVEENEDEISADLLDASEPLRRVVGHETRNVVEQPADRHTSARERVAHVEVENIKNDMLTAARHPDKAVKKLVKSKSHASTKFTESQLKEIKANVDDLTKQLGLSKRSKAKKCKKDMQQCCGAMLDPEGATDLGVVGPAPAVMPGQIGLHCVPKHSVKKCEGIAACCQHVEGFTAFGCVV